MKTTKTLLSILLSVLMIVSACAVAFAEGQTWVPIKTSADTLEKGDLYMDLASIKDTYIERAVYSSLCNYVQPKDPNWSRSDPPKFNNLCVVACEKLANLYPELWDAALQETLAEYNEEYPNYPYTTESFSVIQDSWDVLFEKVCAAHPELGFTDWNSLGSYGYAYIAEEYPDALAMAAEDAETDFARYENADWSYDSSFSGRSWLKAVFDGDQLWNIPDEIKESFLEYGVVWQPVAADIASVQGEGGFYLNGNGIEVTLSEEEIASIEERGDLLYEMYVDRLPTTIQVGPEQDDQVEVQDETQLREEINKMIENQITERQAQMAEYYGTFLDGATLLVNPDKNSLFQISLTKTYTNYSGSFERTTCFPLSEKTGGGAVTTEMLWDCVSAYSWTWNDDETAFVTVTTGFGEEIETVEADVSFETKTEAQVGVAGEKLATATATVNDTVLTAEKSFAIPALDPPDEPDTPDEPTEPTNPDQPDDSGLCKWCEKDHSGSVWQKIVGFFHSILYFFAHLFGMR